MFPLKDEQEMKGCHLPEASPPIPGASQKGMEEKAVHPDAINCRSAVTI
jgi:hypothetical protein